MKSNPRYRNLEDFQSHTDYLNYMYGDVSGFIARGIISDDGKGTYHESFSFSDRLIYRNKYFGVENVYTSMNTFLTRYKHNDERSGRKVSNLKHLNALYLDLDCYKIGMSQETALEELERSYFGKKIPIPTFVIDSGRGIYLIWKISEDRNALPRWNNVQHYLYEQCKCFNADPKAVDAARILRVPNSINGNNGEPVRIIRFNNVKYTLYEIIKQYDIKPKGKEKKQKNAITYPYGQATDRQRRTAQWQANSLGIELPDFTDYQATFDFIHNNCNVQQKINNVYHASTRNSSMALSLERRVSDLFKLFSMRKGVDCCREIALFLCRLWSAERTNDFEYALEQTRALNRTFDVPFDDKYLETRTKSAETILKRGNSYRYSLNNLIRILGITESEQRELTVLRRRTVEQIEKKKSYNRDSYLQRLQKENKSSKKDALKIRREKIAELIIGGKDKAQICSELNISHRTYDRDKAVIVADGLIEQLREKTKTSKTTLKDVVEAKKIRNNDKKRTVKNAQGYCSPFFKHSYYKRTPIRRSAYTFSNLYYINTLEGQLSWGDILIDFGGADNSVDNDNSS